MIKIGIVLAALTALLKGFQSLYQKRCALDTDEYVTGWSNRFFGLLAILPLVMLNGLPDIAPIYWAFLVFNGVASAVASVLIARSYSLSDVSLVAPMFALTPVFMLVTSPLMLGEFPSLFGIVGVFLITAGAYFLKTGETVLEPFRKLWSERGLRIIMVVVVLYSITANVGKLGVQSSGPIFWAFSAYTASACFQFPRMVRRADNWTSSIRLEWRNLMLLGALGGASIVFQMMALEETLAVYVIAIKRLSIPVSVLAGSLVFNEEDLKDRMFGSLLMAAGAVIISLSI